MKQNMEDVEITDEDIKQALERPSDFGYFGDLPLFDTWGLYPGIKSRDSRLTNISNYEALTKALLLEYPEFEDEYEFFRANHWAAGWVEHLAFRVLDENNKPTKIFKFLKSWFNELENYPVADEDDYNDRWYEATIDNISNVMCSIFEDDPPDNWESLVYSWLDENNQGALEDCEDMGAWPRADDIVEALVAIGYSKYLQEEVLDEFAKV